MGNSTVYLPKFTDLELVGEMNLIFSWGNYLAQRQFKRLSHWTIYWQPISS